MPAKRVHIFGASGSGTSTLGRALAERHDMAFFDSDDFFWEKTDPPYQTPKEHTVRQKLMLDALQRCDRWICSGSLCGWGDDAVALFDLAVFLTAPTTLRLQRLRDREARRFGHRVAPGGDMYEQHRKFLEWASQYDDGSPDMRSRRLHEQWLLKLPCRVRRLDGSRPLDELCEQLAAEIAE
jgi:adenylate kinase family enzyme